MEETVGFDKAEYELLPIRWRLGRFRLHQLQQQRTVVEGRHRRSRRSARSHNMDDMVSPGGKDIEAK